MGKPTKKVLTLVKSLGLTKKHLIPIRLDWDKKKKKKIATFPKGYTNPKTMAKVLVRKGDGKAVQPNAYMIVMPKGVYSVDIDTKKVPKHYTKFVKALGNATVTTARGTHTYIQSDVPMTNHQNIFKDKEAFGVDIRGADSNGLCFLQYDGKSKHISYEVAGKPIKDKKFKIFKALPVEVREPKVRKAKDVERGDVGESKKSDIKRMLSKIDVKKFSDRDSWMGIIASIYFALGDKGEKIARKWSKGDKKNYDESSFDNIWKQCVRGNFGESYTVGSLKYHAEEVHQEDTFEAVKPTKEQKKAEKKKKKELAEFDPWRDSGKQHTLKEAKAMGKQKRLFGGVIVERSLLFWATESGAMKTTTSAYAVGQVALKNPNKKVIFYSLDTTPDHERAILQYYEELGIKNIKMIIGATAAEFWEYIYKVTESGADLKDYVYLVDVYAKVASGINTKEGNTRDINRLKQIVKTNNATLIILGHTNKDNNDSSGTAEVEQLSDGIIGVDRIIDEQNQRGILTFKPYEGKRVRFYFEPFSLSYEHIKTEDTYKYLLNALRTLKMDSKLDTEIALDNIKAKKFDEKKDKKIASLLKRNKFTIEAIKSTITRLLNSPNKNVRTSTTLIIAELKKLRSEQTKANKRRINSTEVVAGSNNVGEILKHFRDVGTELSVVRKKTKKGTDTYFYYLYKDKKQAKELKKRLLKH